MSHDPFLPEYIAIIQIRIAIMTANTILREKYLAWMSYCLKFQNFPDNKSSRSDFLNTAKLKAVKFLILPSVDHDTTVA